MLGEEVSGRICVGCVVLIRAPGEQGMVSCSRSGVRVLSCRIGRSGEESAMAKIEQNAAVEIGEVPQSKCNSPCR